MQSVFGIMFVAVFAMSIGIFIFGFAKIFQQWNKNNHAPRLTVPATIVAKRSRVSRAGDSHTTHYYVTFQVESGDRMELPVSGYEVGMLVEGDRGMLTFQGTRYLSFTRGRNTYDSARYRAE